MKRNATKSVLMAFALVALAAGSARANTITPTPSGFLPGVSISYSADLSSGQMQTGDGFTIYDIGGFDGNAASILVASAYAWTVTAQVSGSPLTPTVGGLLTPDTGDYNVTFRYAGAGTINQPFGSSFLGIFTIPTTSLFVDFDEWLSNDHNATLSGSNGSAATPHQDEILVPQHVPDGGSTAMLLGSVLFAFGAVRRKFNGR